MKQQDAKQLLDLVEISILLRNIFPQDPTEIRLELGYLDSRMALCVRLSKPYLAACFGADPLEIGDNPWQVNIQMAGLTMSRFNILNIVGQLHTHHRHPSDNLLFTCITSEGRAAQFDFDLQGVKETGKILASGMSLSTYHHRHQLPII